MYITVYLFGIIKVMFFVQEKNIKYECKLTVKKIKNLIISKKFWVRLIDSNVIN